MHGRKSCWEVIEESMFLHHKKRGMSKYPLFAYVSGHFRFFHKGGIDENIIEEYQTKFIDWRDEEKEL